MAEFMFSLPGDLLDRVDAEAERRGISRDALLEAAVRREMGGQTMPTGEILARLDALASGWAGTPDTTAALRADRDLLH